MVPFTWVQFNRIIISTLKTIITLFPPIVMLCKNKKNVFFHSKPMNFDSAFLMFC